MIRLSRFAASALTLSVIAPALAADPPACPPPSADSFWPSGASSAEGGVLVPGKAAQVALQQGKDGKYSGKATVDVPSAGTYAVSLGSAAWIDLAENGQVISSIGHGHGPACSGIRKIVRFTLHPGRHEVLLSRSNQERVQVLIERTD